MKKRLSAAKADAGLAASDRIDLAQLSSVRQELGRLRAAQTDLEEARALLEHGRKVHSVDQKRIRRLEEEVKAIAEIEQQLLDAQNEAYAAKIQNASLLKELEKAQDASKSLQNLSEKALWDKNAEANVQLQAALEKKTLLEQETEAQAREIICLSADLTSANQREARKADELRVATEEARRLQVVADQYVAEINRLRGENAVLTKGLEDASKQQLQDLANSMTENRKLSIELDSSRSENSRLLANIQHMQETEQLHVEALRRSSKEREALSRQLGNLKQHLGTAQELRKCQMEELEATVAALEQQCKSQEGALQRVQCLNEELEASLETVRQQHRDQEKRDCQRMEGMRTELKEAQMQQEAAKHRSTAAAAKAAREKEWTTKCAALQARVEQLQETCKVDAAQRQEEKVVLRQQQQELASCKGLLRKMLQPLANSSVTGSTLSSWIEDFCELSSRVSVERALTEAAWARTLEEQVQQRVSILEKDFALRIAKYGPNQFRHKCRYA
ncbi:hypothetical protein Emed_005772 [Eimeria media]